MDDLEAKLKSILESKKVERNKDISRNLTLRTKTKAELYTEALSREELTAIIKAAHEFSVPFLVLGGGSNMAVTKDTIPGLVIRNYYIKKELLDQTDEYADVLFSSGFPISRVVGETVKDGLSGFEYHLGLPGTLGGALYMNSKWTKPEVYCGDSLIYANIINHSGQERRVEKEYFQFAYDYSILQKTKEIVLDAVFRLKKMDPEVLMKRSKDALQYRKDTQPFGVATSGCFFQNISPDDVHGDPQTSAGYYIDRAGLKNKSIGNFMVSDKHANFIINKGEGKPEDLIELINFIKKTVHDKFGVQLKEEVLVI